MCVSLFNAFLHCSSGGLKRTEHKIIQCCRNRGIIHNLVEAHREDGRGREFKLGNGLFQPFNAKIVTSL